MRFLILVKATPASEAGEMPEAGLMDVMADYHDQLAKAGALLDASGLRPSADAWRIQYEGNSQTVVDGPFTESKELVAGYTLIQARSREEALEWTRRFPNPAGEGKRAEIEVRPLYSLDEFPPSAALERFKALEGQH